MKALQIITILLISLIMSNQINTIKMDSFDLEAILLEDQARQPGTPERYAYTFDVDINLFDLADIQILDNGDKIWKLSIQSDNAIGMKFVWIAGEVKHIVFKCSGMKRKVVKFFMFLEMNGKLEIYLII